MKLYIIANRLPVKAKTEKGTLVFSRSEGGLTTGLDSLQGDFEKHWIGWPGVCTEKEEEKQAMRQELAGMNFHPLFLSQQQYQNYYEGYSNSTLWPLCHYFYAYTLYKHPFWKSYQEVNELFCREICRLIGPEDWVWIQDYQLMLLPAMLRRERPSLHIGYFHHIPFPSYELFRILPERADLLKGLLGADFIAFHTYNYMRHFISAVERVLHIESNLDEIRMDNRKIRVDALPMGINYDLYHQAVKQVRVQQAIARSSQMFGRHKLILSVDRLDYSKGILHRLKGFASFLEHHPEYHEAVTLAMVIVPSRDQVDSYADLKTRIDKEIGAINGRYSTMNWTPVCYFYHGFSFEELVSLYAIAHVALVTPLRDGMNLVAKEYVAVKQDCTGVLILSEMAGAAVELTDALLVNPNDTDQIEEAICRALEMPEEEQRERIRRMQQIISVQTVHKWAADFVDEWQEIVSQNRRMRMKCISPKIRDEVRHAYRQAQRRLILLDYDGTLAALCKRPEEALPTPELLELLQRLASDPLNHVVINSGRDQATLEQWFGALPISLAAEHGASYKEEGVWHTVTHHPVWNRELIDLMRVFVHKTPHAHLEMKETTLAWHYRESDVWLGNLRAQQLTHALLPLCQRKHWQIMKGDKVIEVKLPDYTKGSEVKRLLQKEQYDFMIAMGDDVTDDDMFQALPPMAYTIKIGAVSDGARFNLPAQTDTLPFLQQLAESPIDDNFKKRGLKDYLVKTLCLLKRLVNHSSFKK